MTRPSRSFSLRRRILDRLCLLPTRQPLDPGPQQRFWVNLNGQPLECFRQWQGPGDASPAPVSWLEEAERAGTAPRVDRLVIKWAGNAGRAERSTLHPAGAWTGEWVEVWTINPPGYGGSRGRASLDHARPMAIAVWEHALRSVPDVPIVLFGNSIGSLTALHAARYAAGTAEADRLCGLLLRNPPPLGPLIRRHYARWYHLGVPRLLVSACPVDWDAERLAAGSRCPLLLLQSEWDEIVPPEYQELIYRAYAGPKSRFVLARATHDHVPTPADGPLYTAYLAAIRHQFTPQRHFGHSKFG